MPAAPPVLAAALEGCTFLDSSSDYGGQRNIECNHEIELSSRHRSYGEPGGHCCQQNSHHAGPEHRCSVAAGRWAQGSPEARFFDDCFGRSARPAVDAERELRLTPRAIDRAAM
jgi:hypothetical protein